jgi:hypothetical protein
VTYLSTPWSGAAYALTMATKQRVPALLVTRGVVSPTSDGKQRTSRASRHLWWSQLRRRRVSGKATIDEDHALIAPFSSDETQGDVVQRRRRGDRPEGAMRASGCAGDRFARGEHHK